MRLIGKGGAEVFLSRTSMIIILARFVYALRDVSLAAAALRRAE
jgi:hypothetical protein